MNKFPQTLINVRVKDKYHVTDNEKVKAAIEAVEADMNGNGRILVRPSGTEPLVRVMVEAATEEDSVAFANRIVAVVHRRKWDFLQKNNEEKMRKSKTSFFASFLFEFVCISMANEFLLIVAS